MRVHLALACMAAVPKAQLVVIGATLGQFNIPEAGLLLIMGVDTFLDMGRTATNILGNSIASSAVAKWEGQLGAELSEEEYAALEDGRRGAMDTDPGSGRDAVVATS